MGEILVRFEGAQEIIIDKLLKTGIFKTKSEAIRAGIINLGKEYNIFKSIDDLENELALNKMQKISKGISNGKIKLLSEKEIKKQYSLK